MSALPQVPDKAPKKRMFTASGEHKGYTAQVVADDAALADEAALAALDAAEDPQRRRRRRKKPKTKGLILNVSAEYVAACLDAEIVVRQPCGWTTTASARTAIAAAKEHRNRCSACARVPSDMPV